MEEIAPLMLGTTDFSSRIGECRGMMRVVRRDWLQQAQRADRVDLSFGVQQVFLPYIS